MPASVAVAAIFSRRPCADPNSTADRAPDRPRRLQLLHQRRVGHPEQYHVDGLVEIGQRRHAGQLADAVVARIDQMHTGRTPLRLEDHPRAEAVGAGTGAHHRHRPGAEHGGDRCPACARSSLRNRRRRPRFWIGETPRAPPASRGYRTRRRRRAWPELPLYSPEIGCSVVGVARCGPHVEQLLQRQLTVEDVAADQAVLLLHLVRPDDVAMRDRRLEARARPGRRDR